MRLGKRWVTGMHLGCMEERQRRMVYFRQDMTMYIVMHRGVHSWRRTVEPTDWYAAHSKSNPLRIAAVRW